LLHARTSLLIACTAACIAVSTTATAQRGVINLTATGVGHKDAKISPNGRIVAFITDDQGVPALGTIPTTKGNKESILVKSAKLITFHWRADSTGIYYQDDASINFITSFGGTPKQVTKVSGNNVRFLAVDPKGLFLMGTRADAARANAIFTVQTNGATLAKDVLSSKNDFFDHLVVDPSGTKFAYTSQPTSVQFSPVDVRLADADGKNDKSLSNGGLTGVLPNSLSWADNGTTLLFSGTHLGTPQIMRLTTTNSTPVILTDGPQVHLRSSVSPDLGWVVYAATTLHGHFVPGLMPVSGGGRILLEPEQNWIMSGAPTVDLGSLRVAFAAKPTGIPSVPEIQLIEFDREVVVKPRAELGKSVTFELPVALGERGTLFASTGLLHPDPKKGATLVKLPGIEYAVALDPRVLLLVLSGVGDGKAPLSVNATVPNDTALLGFTVYLQGLRVKSTNPDKGDLTRYVELQFFK